jgi:tetratricopeptide (TPR) repeat protein
MPQLRDTAGVPRSWPIVGQAAELELLSAAYARAAAGQSQVMLVTGEAGIGKTRLVEELRDRVLSAANGAQVRVGEGEADALTRIGDLCLRKGHPDDAVRYLREAMALYQELGSRSGEADALNSLGEVLLAVGQPDHARAEYAAALDLAAQTGGKYQQARAHHGLGEACRAGGDPGGARRHWQQALALFAELGTPEADQVRAQLATAQDGRRAKQETSR